VVTKSGQVPLTREEHLEAGHAALKGGDFASARKSFEAVMALGEDPEGRMGLGATLPWLSDIYGAIAHLEQAYAAFRRRPEPLLAAVCAARIAFHQIAHLSNAAAASGWLSRATRLVEEHGLDPIRGELLLVKGLLADEPEEGERWAREALEIGRRSGDHDLELCGLSQLGAVLVAQGRTTEGIALLDEAMAGCLGGEPGNLETVVFACCHTMVALARCADFERAMQWVRAAERFVDRYGAPFFHAECRSVYARVLFGTGDWSRADAAAREAIELARGSVPAFEAGALATLAELWLAKGRLEEAERLFVGRETGPEAIPALARIQLSRGEPALAVAIIRRRLNVIGESQLESSWLLELLGEAEIAQGEAAIAVERGRTLVELGLRLGCEVIAARGHRLSGRALAETDVLVASRSLDQALSCFVRLQMPYEAARTRFLLAQATCEAQPELAARDARAALDAFDSLGAAADADRTASLLRKLGVKAARVGPKRPGTLTKREREVLALLGEGLSNPEIAKRLFVSRKTVEHHVANVLSKLELTSRAQAAAEAVRLGEVTARK
jgi:DNA-binding CsgD family transcriptional regulator